MEFDLRFCVIFDGLDSLSLGGNLLSQILQAALSVTPIGHSEITASLSRWHDSYVLESPTLLWASLPSVMLQDRSIRLFILAAINSDAKTFIRSTFLREMAVFLPTLPHCIPGDLEKRM